MVHCMGSYDMGGRVGVGVAPMWRSTKVLDSYSYSDSDSYSYSYLCFLLMNTLTPSKMSLQSDHAPCIVNNNTIWRRCAKVLRLPHRIDQHVAMYCK